MGKLVSLKHLDLQGSNLSGPIPRSLGNLSQLNYLELSRNSFGGQFPYSLTNLTQLKVLHIGDNQLEGSIPDEVTAFPNLISLDLSSNLLSGTLPSWLYMAPSLKYIYLVRNQFSGHIKEFQYNALEVIKLYDNKLHGPIPSSISQLVNLIQLDLSSNNLSGTLEFSMLSKLQNLQYLDLSQNSPSLNSNGTSVDYTLPNLQSLYLPSCNINEFPQFLRGSKRLQYLDLSSNRIYGNIPKWMWDVGKDSLSYLNLSHNFLTQVEQLPWKKINFLDLSSNLIYGDLPVPPSTTNVFLISNNSLSGEISSLICNLSHLEILDLSHNNLSGIIPDCFGNLSKHVSMLNLRMNKFYGIIPPTFAKGCQLSNLNLNGNQLEGPLTRSIINCRGLEVLDWTTTCDIYKKFKAMINLTGDKSETPYMGVSSGGRFYSYSIAIAIKGIKLEVVKIFTKFTTIDLSNNSFQGEIPKVIGTLRSLKGLNLSHNDLNGSIPTSIGNLTNLEWLDFSSNKLIGTIPWGLLDMTSLSFFNVSENQLDGQIPQGRQFNTFGNDSYEGNMGLCGFPVSKGCSTIEPPPPQFLPPNLLEEDDSKSNIGFGWKVVLIGYGCGVIFGLAIGYVVFQTGKPKWFVTLVEDQHHKRRKKSKIRNRSGGGRRI
ncbi:hypothetical protein REPUB_Repub05bG0012000 [Reevesia pubescens]